MLDKYHHVATGITGAYALVHVYTDAAYVGSSGRCVANRLSWHEWALDRQRHTSPRFQAAWNETARWEWDIYVQPCTAELCVTREQELMDLFPGLLNCKLRADGVGHEHRADSVEKMRVSRAAYLETPGARESLAERARQQHAESNFGQATQSEADRAAAWIGTRSTIKRRGSRAKSGYYGVIETPNGLFCAYIYDHGKRRELGRYRTAELAAAAYDAASRRLFGELAYVNLPD